jgi:hypothetical protein
MPRQKSLTVANQHPGSDFGTVVQHPVVTTESMHSRQPYLWCFCKLCGRQTEYAVALESVRIFKRLKNGTAKAVPISDRMRADAQRYADDLVALYEQALSRIQGQSPPDDLLLEHCDIREMRGDFSVESFRDQVERRTLLIEWAKHGDMSGSARLPGNPKGAQRPSKMYCDLHYPGRTEDARRAYQRDRRFVAEFDELIAEFWAQYAGHIREWNLDDHALVRHAAYHHLQLMKAPTRILDEVLNQQHTENPSAKLYSSTKSIDDYYEVARAAHRRIRRMKEPKDWLDDLNARGMFNQSEVARHLGIKRQAVSAALKRKSAAADQTRLGTDFQMKSS